MEELQMKFETEQGQPIFAPTKEDIRNGIASMDGNENSFAILSLSDMTYMQTSGQSATGFVLEYQNGSLDEHYSAKNREMDMNEVLDTFFAFSEGDTSWFDRLEWEKEDLQPKGGCLFLFVAISALSWATVVTIERFCV